MHLECGHLGQDAASTIVYIIDNVATTHPLDPYFNTLKIDGRLVVCEPYQHNDVR
jgi:hypothetical protein